MPKTSRDRGPTLDGSAVTAAQEPMLLGKRLIIRDGQIEFLPGDGGLADAILSRAAAGIVRLVGGWRLEGAASTTDVLGVRVTGDTVDQLVVNANGRLEWSSGSDPADVALFRDGSLRLHTINTFVTEGDLQCDTAGGGLTIKEGANARMGAATLVAGAATVETTEVSATSRILLTSQVDGGTPGWLRVSTRTAGTSFTITSSSGSDTSTVAWFIVEPAA